MFYFAGPENELSNVTIHIGDELITGKITDS